MIYGLGMGAVERGLNYVEQYPGAGVGRCSPSARSRCSPAGASTRSGHAEYLSPDALSAGAGRLEAWTSAAPHARSRRCGRAHRATKAVAAAPLVDTAPSCRGRCRRRENREALGQHRAHRLQPCGPAVPRGEATHRRTGRDGAKASLGVKKAGDWSPASLVTGDHVDVGVGRNHDLAAGIRHPADVCYSRYVPPRRARDRPCDRRCGGCCRTAQQVGGTSRQRKPTSSSASAMAGASSGSGAQDGDERQAAQQGFDRHFSNPQFATGPAPHRRRRPRSHP